MISGADWLMAFKRIVAPAVLLSSHDLGGVLAGIGFNLAVTPLEEPNIEDALFAASIEGMEHDDLRVLAILTTWLSVHHARINADRLYRIAGQNNSDRVRAYWAAIGSWLAKDRRLARFNTLYKGPRLNLLRVGTEFQLRRKGEDPRFKDSPISVPARVLRDRAADVMTPPQLAKRHLGYRWRVAMGPSYRADMWALLESQPSLAPAELARLAYGSFATGWQVKHDWDLLKSA